MPQNVLILVCDTARAGATPTVAQLASQGSAADNIFSTACWTLPSHASMFTGILPRALGLGQAPGGTPHGARPVLEAHAERLLPEVFRRAGWDTRGVSTNLWVSPYSGFSTGFEQFEYVQAGARQERVERNELRGRVVWAYEGLRARADDGAGQAEAALRRWIGELSDRPFFWFVNLVECHSPYLPPRPYNDLGPVDRIRAADEARRYLSLDAIWRTCLTRFDLPADAVARMRHLYARSVRLMDDWLARVLQALDDRGVLDDTLVLVTSDHGENFGEGGLLGHAFSLDDRLIRIPFVVNRSDFQTGDGARSLVELPRMLARYLGVDATPWTEPGLPDGQALAQFDFVEEGDPRVAIAAEEWGLTETAQAQVTVPLTCATDGRLKLMRRGEAEELYDLAADPLEEKPVPAAGHPDQAAVARLREAIATPAATETGSALPAAPPPPDEAADLEARMKLLGYM
jgi:arylsulfatase A-like enzyme